MTLLRLEVRRPVRSLRDIDPTPKWVQQLPTFVGWGLIWLSTLVGAYGLRAMQDFHFAIHAEELAAQAERDTAAADSLVAGCLSVETANRLLGASERTAGLLASRQAYQRWIFHLTSRGAEYVASAEP